MRWYYAESGSAIGPYSREEMISKAAEGLLTAEMLVWSDAADFGQEWRSAADAGLISRPTYPAQPTNQATQTHSARPIRQNQESAILGAQGLNMSDDAWEQWDRGEWQPANATQQRPEQRAGQKSGQAPQSGGYSQMSQQGAEQSFDRSVGQRPEQRAEQRYEPSLDQAAQSGVRSRMARRSDAAAAADGGRFRSFVRGTRDSLAERFTATVDVGSIGTAARLERRLGAFLLNVALPFFVYVVWRTREAFGFLGMMLQGYLMIGLSISMLAASGLYSLYTLYDNGQSIGKKVAMIRITDLDGFVPPIWRILVLRWSPFYIMGILFYFCGVIPALVILLIDAAPMLRKDRRALHDILAGTVILAE